MRKRIQIDLSSLLANLQNEIVTNRPTVREMFDEVRMMKFRIRPLQGDISLINLHDHRLIEALWSLGKLDDFFQRSIKNIPIDQKELFLRAFESLQQKFQQQLNKITFQPERSTDSAILEMEIFRQHSIKKQAN